MNVAADGFAVIEEGASVATPWMPPSAEEDG
jgi:hypothetical protein